MSALLECKLAALEADKVTAIEQLHASHAEQIEVMQHDHEAAMTWAASAHALALAEKQAEVTDMQAELSQMQVEHTKTCADLIETMHAATNLTTRGAAAVCADAERRAKGTWSGKILRTAVVGGVAAAVVAGGARLSDVPPAGTGQVEGGVKMMAAADWGLGSLQTSLQDRLESLSSDHLERFDSLIMNQASFEGAVAHSMDQIVVSVDDLAYKINSVVDSKLNDEVVTSLDQIYEIVLRSAEAMTTTYQAVAEQNRLAAQKEAEAEARAQQYFERANWGHSMPDGSQSAHGGSLQVVEVTEEEWLEPDSADLSAPATAEASAHHDFLGMGLQATSPASWGWGSGSSNYGPRCDFFGPGSTLVAGEHLVRCAEDDSHSHAWLSKPHIMWLQSNGRLIVSTGGTPTKPGHMLWSSGLPKMKLTKLMTHGGHFIAERLTDGSIVIKLVGRSAGQPDLVVREIGGSRIHFQKWPFVAEEAPTGGPTAEPRRMGPLRSFFRGLNGVRRNFFRMFAGQPKVPQIGQ